MWTLSAILNTACPIFDLSSLIKQLFTFTAPSSHEHKVTFFIDKNIANVGFDVRFYIGSFIQNYFKTRTGQLISQHGWLNHSGISFGCFLVCILHGDNFWFCQLLKLQWQYLNESQTRLVEFLGLFEKGQSRLWIKRSFWDVQPACLNCLLIS